MDTERFTFAQMLSTAILNHWAFTLELCPHCAIGAVCEHEDDTRLCCCSWCEEVWSEQVAE